MKWTLIFCGLFFCQSVKIIAQTDSIYTQAYLEKSTKFAWLTFGGDINWNTGGSTNHLIGEIPEALNFGATILPRLTIGGIHFWGHADFYVTFPLSFISYQQVPEGLADLEVYQGVETGARIYPFKIQSNSLRPFAGISFRRIRFAQEADASGFENGVPSFGRFIHPIQLGITYSSEKWHISASSYINYQNEFDYYISPNQVTDVTLDPVSFNISFLRYLDSDKGLRDPKVVKQVNKDYGTLNAKNLLNAWFIGIGPSAALQISKSPFLKNNYPYFFDDFSAALLPDVSFGRYFSNTDLNVGLSYRTYGEKYEGFDNEITTRRHSIGVESIKFLFNYLGFVPFVGTAFTYENMRASVNGVNFTESKPAIGFVFGWDIRVTKTSTGVLRTNLRYFPDLHMDIEGDKMMFDHLEFNFIQWVQFLGRKKALREARMR